MADDPLSSRRRWLAPEVVQTSAMDCGPASLKCLLEGFGISASYGRLREACQIDVDGTSIDTLEEVAGDLGLEAEQVMIPADHLLLPEAAALPAIAVVRLPSGLTHFLIVWRTHGRLVQLMDPATGRRWPTRRSFLNQLYIHTMPVSASDWREWAGTDDFLQPLTARLAALGVSPGERGRLLTRALDDSGWASLGALDASARLVSTLRRSGGLGSGRQASTLLESLSDRARDEAEQASPPVPDSFWSVRPLAEEEAKEKRLEHRGAVLARIHGRRAPAAAVRLAEEVDAEQAPGRLSPELAAALEEPPPRPGRMLARLIRAGGRFAPVALGLGLLLAAGAVVFEALLFRGFFDIGNELALTSQRIGALVVLVVFLAALLMLELPLAEGVQRLGRHLESRLRIAFLEKLPRLGDRYFRSRTTSDMAERSHSVHRLRQLPLLGEGLARAGFGLLMTTCGIIWLDPGSALLAILTAATGLLLPLLALPVLEERDLRVRNHIGALSHFYLDALLGLVPVRTHSAERAVAREHESLVVEWARAHLNREKALIAVDTLLYPVLLSLIAWLLFAHLQRTGLEGGVLLLVFWSLNLFALARMVTLVIAQQYPTYRSVTLRLLEPLGAAAEPRPESSAPGDDEPSAEAPGLALRFEGVAVHAGGHTILEEIDLDLAAGSHVALVGPSGAGKTTLAGLLLGWHRPARGRLLVDGEALSPQRLSRLRREIAWVDPDVQLWNRSLLRNLRYGAEETPDAKLGWALQQADLLELLEQLPDGLQTTLGESGALVSGGEGQRVRLGRGLLRPSVRLVILDEPFRGLARSQRRELLGRARRLWKHATLLCITHDVWETTHFDRVVVLEAGRIAEEGRPESLAASPTSRFGRLLRAETALVEKLWNNPRWRRVRMEERRLVDVRAPESG